MSTYVLEDDKGNQTTCYNRTAAVYHIINSEPEGNPVQVTDLLGTEVTIHPYLLQYSERKNELYVLDIGGNQMFRVEDKDILQDMEADRVDDAYEKVDDRYEEVLEEYDLLV